MKFRTRIFFLLSATFSFGAMPTSAATELNEAELITIVNQVTLGDQGGAKLNEKVAEKIPLSTGAGSFAELKFKDSSILRLAPESKMSFLSKERSLKLEQGSLLANVPVGQGGIRIDADGIVGEVTGTTLMASRDQEGNFGFVILETTGTAKVTSHTGKTATLVPGQIALVRKSDGSIRVLELNLDAVVQFSPLFTSFERPLPSLDRISAVADNQANEVKNEMKSLLSYVEAGLNEQDPEKGPLSALFGKSMDEIVVAKNPFLGELATAAGSEESGEGVGMVLGADPAGSGPASDARQPEGEEIASKSNPPSGDATAGLGDTDTAAGGEDLASTDTAAGGGGGADTQAPTAPAPVGGGVTVDPPDATPTGATG